MEIFEGIRNGAVSEIIQNFELKRARNGIAKEDVEELLNQVCNRYEQDSVNVVPATEHHSLKEKAAKLEAEVANLKTRLSDMSESEESMKENRDMISEILIESKNRAKKIVDEAEEAAKALRDKSSAEAVALRQKTQAERKKILDEAEALKKDIIGKATDKAMAIEDSKRNVLSDADAEKNRIISQATERANTLEEEGKKRLEDANAEADSIILNAKETAEKIVKEGDDSLEESKFAAESMIEKAKIEFEKIKADAAQEEAAILEKAKAKAATIVSNGYYEQEQLNIQNKELADRITAKKEEFAAYIKTVESNFASMSECLIDFKKDLNIMFLSSSPFEDDDAEMIESTNVESEEVKSGEDE